MSKVQDIVRARVKARIAAAQQGAVRLESPPAKTKAELQDELTAVGIEYPKSARKADLEALLPESNLDEIAAEDIEAAKS